MGVRTTIYIIAGIKIPLDEFKYGHDDNDDDGEALEPYRDSSYDSKVGAYDGLTVLIDGMGGEYAVIGQCLIKVRGEDVYIDGFIFMDDMVNDCDINVRRGISQKIFEHFGILEPEITLMLFTHFT